MTDTIEVNETPEDALNPRQVTRIREAVAAEDAEAIAAETETLHPADIADLLEQMSEPDRAGFLSLWAGEEMGEVLSELDEGLRQQVIALLEPASLSAAVKELETDDLVDLVEDLDDSQRGVILDALDPGDRYAVQQSLTYPEETAGRLMQRNVVTAPEDWTVGQIIDHMREAEHLPEQFYYVTLIDPKLAPMGHVTLGRVLGSSREAQLRDLMEPNFITIPVRESQESVAYAFNQYHLISAPVIDDVGRLVGVVTIDDAMSVLSEEAEEDLLRLAGVGEQRKSDNLLSTVKSRLPWLFVNLITAILASVVINQFEPVLSQIVALAILMPIVASMGGNAGTQSMTVAVRAITTRDLTRANAVRVVRREATVGLINGLAFAVTMGIVSVIWFGGVMLGVVMAIAMVLTLIAAAAGGVLVPIALDKLKIDPAVASGPFVTTITDVVGFFVFLGIATLVLM